uniref:Uncharacterized protein n=1 Tax=Anguilla anguilla TaxID=7936 RepID=A0A0E9QA09_ANGAN
MEMPVFLLGAESVK